MSVYAGQSVSPARLDQVAEQGRHVMPFNLDKTLHVFDKTEYGGLQQVIVKDNNDTQQIRLIRKHLSDIGNKFVQGDFSGPRRIHGDDMPGIKELSAGARHMHFQYQDLPNGGQIEYRSDDPQLINAIHNYFDAQLRDHVRHAMPVHHAQPQ